MSFPTYQDLKISGVDWLGRIPAHWRVKKFRHLFRESPEKIEESVIGPMLSVSGYRGIEIKKYDDENRRRLDAELVGYRIVRVGQLVVNTMWLNYAGLGVSDYEGHVSPAYRCYWISEELQKRYVNYLMRDSVYVRGYTRLLTGVRPNSLQMSRDDLMEFPVVCPPRLEQIAIVTFLDRETAKIDALMEEQGRLIELLKEKRQSAISHAVAKGLDPDVSTKDSCVEWFGEVPRHWKVTTLKHHWSVIDCKHLTAEFIDNGVPIASIREAQSRFIDLNSAKKTTDEYYQQLIEGGRKPEPGDLIFTRNATVGEVAQVADWHPPFAMGQDVCLLRKTHPDFSTDYFWYVLRSSGVANQLSNLVIGSTFKRVNVEDVRNLVVPVPDSVEQVAVAAFLDTQTKMLDALITEAESAIILLQERRAALISAAVTGKIDVRGLVPLKAEAA
jgi:type I restriction enzyme S subunit